jgi:hypothetical protein
MEPPPAWLREETKGVGIEEGRVKKERGGSGKAMWGIVSSPSDMK